MVSIVATASYRAVESTTRLRPTSPAALAASSVASKMRSGCSERRRRSRMSTSTVCTKETSLALVAPDSTGVAPAGVVGEALGSFTVGETVEALEHHHHRDHRGRHRATTPLGEEVVEHLVGEEVVALAVQERVDRVLGQGVLAEAGQVIEQIALTGSHPEGHSGQGRELHRCNSLTKSSITRSGDHFGNAKNTSHLGEVPAFRWSAALDVERSEPHENASIRAAARLADTFTLAWPEHRAAGRPRRPRRPRRRGPSPRRLRPQRARLGRTDARTPRGRKCPRRSHVAAVSPAPKGPSSSQRGATTGPARAAAVSARSVVVERRARPAIVHTFSQSVTSCAARSTFSTHSRRANRCPAACRARKTRSGSGAGSRTPRGTVSAPSQRACSRGRG